MVRTKTKKLRGSKRHGRGYKSGRGAGLRGGRGNAGLHKHKVMHMIKYMPDHFGVHGFKRPRSVIKKIRTINVGELEEMYPGQSEIDLTKDGYDKLLGGGVINSKLTVIVKSATSQAVKKITEKGGLVKTES
jgi:large subunit ribosomal protein L15